MTPSAILKVLSTVSSHEVQYLLMGGQACVLYGGAEFSRDCDIAIVCETSNLGRLQNALDELQASVIAVPPFEAQYLQRGHAVHFRCHHPEAADMRLDVMASMRGVGPFADLWSRRTTLTLETNLALELMSLPDLIAAKKTQRDKDWPMIRRLVEANYAQHRAIPTQEQIHFWLRESRTPEMLIEIAARFPDEASKLTTQRPLLAEASAALVESLRQALACEQDIERATDRNYWEPLKQELEQLRLGRR